MEKTVYRAEKPRAPEPTAAMLAEERERAAYLREREAVERRARLRALMILAMVALAFGIVRAGWERAFVSGWWRQW